MRRAVVGLLKLDVVVTLVLAGLARPELLWIIAVVTVIHEAGHAAMARSLRVQTGVRLSLRGVRVLAWPRTRGEIVAIALAGPAASLLSGAAFLALGARALGVVSVVGGVTMLIPVKPLDGYVARRSRHVSVYPTGPHGHQYGRCP
jgi:Zn-dependent protease